MLILTRKRDESILILCPSGECVEILVSKIENERVKLGVNAPQSVRIFRKEVYDTMGAVRPKVHTMPEITKTSSTDAKQV
ncbi:MAG: carbon storage regulator [Puniceicoccales bacterium]|jgi:carbon storage regulator|nr:carbon storage regulator [Puniceicoccales bacterium]